MVLLLPLLLVLHRTVTITARVDAAPATGQQLCPELLEHDLIDSSHQPSEVGTLCVQETSHCC